MSKYEAVYFVGDNQASNRVRVDSSKMRNRGAFSRSLAALIFSNPIAKILAYLYNKVRISFKGKGLFSILKYIFGLLTTQSVQI